MRGCSACLRTACHQRFRRHRERADGATVVERARVLTPNADSSIILPSLAFLWPTAIDRGRPRYRLRDMRKFVAHQAAACMTARTVLTCAEYGVMTKRECARVDLIGDPFGARPGMNPDGQYVAFSVRLEECP